ncbi:hypothetical protein CRM22_002340 [Opisthorchis felineus]|uniref:39S ribosomal protein L35, mitochondrial n=1 Tax=Opisthorchis felineus TaxID=147828 RepID=A0A4S2M6E8_OPIFE|nr:hypothetical protein CRM22_002340 [Opisthorchis felineus]
MPAWGHSLGMAWLRTLLPVSKCFGGWSSSALITRQIGPTCSCSHSDERVDFLIIPSRGFRSREVKKYYAEDGTFNPPVQDVIDRFKRLRWGAFVHARSGRSKHLYRRSDTTRDKLQEHILTNRATSFLLNNMLNRQWRAPRYYPEDIYEPYHKRTGVPWSYVQRKPKFFP